MASKPKADLEPYPVWQLSAYLAGVFKGEMPREGESVTVFLRRIAPQFPDKFARLPFDATQIMALPWRFPLLVGTLSGVRSGTPFADNLDEYGEQPLMVSADHQAGKNSFYFLQGLEDEHGLPAAAASWLRLMQEAGGPAKQRHLLVGHRFNGQAFIAAPVRAFWF